MKKLYIIIILLISLLIVFIVFNKKDNNTLFSDAKTTKINLDNLNELNISKYGIYSLSGNLNGTITINSNQNIKLILNDVTINSTGPSIYIKNALNTYIELNGDNSLNDTTDYSKYTNVDGVLYSSNDLIIDGDGTLKINANYKDGIVSKDDLIIKNGNFNIDSAGDSIRGKDSVTINNGTFTLNSKDDSIKSTNDTDSSKGNITINNGTFNITSLKDGIQAYNTLTIKNGDFNIKTSEGASLKSTNDSWKFTDTDSAKGLRANDIIIKNGDFNIDSSDDSIHANNDVTISNGDFKISSGDDGIHGDNSITINNGTININESYEGIEASYITINNGNITVNSSDDGFNGSGCNDNSSMNRMGEDMFASDGSLITINDGYIYINATGDGIDSNGSIIMNGGTVLVDGPNDSGNGALDYNDDFEFNKGLLIAAGSSGMAQNIKTGSSYGVLINFDNYMEDTTINIDGIVTYTPSKKFNSIVIASDKFIKGNSYTINYGGECKTDKLCTDSYTNGTVYDTFTINSTTTTVGNTSKTFGPMDRPDFRR